MDTQFIDIVQKLISDQGKDALFNPTKGKSLLADYTGNEYKKEVRLLIQILEAGVAKAIAGASNLETCKKQQVRELQDGYFLAPEIAADVVDMLALVLRGDTLAAQSRTAQPVAALEMPKNSNATGTGSAPAAQSARAHNGFVFVQGGTFQMGEGPQHQVKVSSFYMGKYAVTQREWYEVMGTTVRQQRDMADKRFLLSGEGDNYPMYYVDWYDAIAYCNGRSIKEGLIPAYCGKRYDIMFDHKANGYRLPTEAEWEYAAKGGNKDPLEYAYSGNNNVDAVAWYEKNSVNTIHSVGTKAPNSLGLYDMSGNVWEWCWDWYDSYSSGFQTDPVGASSGTVRVIRGGSWRDSADALRSAYRYCNAPSYRGYALGFRLARSIN